MARCGNGIWVMSSSLNTWFGPHPEEARSAVSKDVFGAPKPYGLMVRGTRSRAPHHEALLNLAAGVPLHPVGHLDQAPPRPLQKRHHAIHVAVARQRDFDLALALALRHLRLALLQRVRFRQRFFDLAGHRGLARSE